MSLQKTMTINEMLSWRFHWLYCDLGEIINNESDCLKKGFTSESALEKVSVIEAKCDRIMWEAETMSGERRVEETLSKTPNKGYMRYTEELARVKKIIWTNHMKETHNTRVNFRRSLGLDEEQAVDVELDIGMIEPKY